MDHSFTGAALHSQETNATQLPPMFKTFRKELAQQLTTRFDIDTTPNRHVLLALKMNPAVNTSADGPQFAGKAAKWEMMQAEYKRALRRQAIHCRRRVQQPELAQQTETTQTQEGATTPSQATPSSNTRGDPAPTAGSKRRRGLMSTVTTLGSGELLVTANREDSEIDLEVKLEIERFEAISLKIIAMGDTCPYFRPKKDRFNLRAFWEEHKTPLPLHYGTYKIWLRSDVRSRLQPTWSPSSRVPASSWTMPGLPGQNCWSASSSSTTTGSMPSCAPAWTRSLSTTTQSSKGSPTLQPLQRWHPPLLRAILCLMAENK